ncbi:MAG: peptidase U34 [Clostridia bacterium]|nr:peptidase U34 [Clostridia bacterium]
MCDTVALFCRDGSGRSFFGKNSDREPGEPQIVYFSKDAVDEFKSRPYIEASPKYIKGPFLALKSIFDKFDNKYSALISRPVWMWGAEMGVNQFGLSIGNEAVFSKAKVSDDALLGMDILRLALHNCKDAKQAVSFITRLINEYGQGGDGGYRGSLKYHNSFIIKDFDQGYILETCGKHWALKEIRDVAAISNSYSITDDFCKADLETDRPYNFKARHENKLVSFFTKGDYRRNYAYNYLKSNDGNLKCIMSLLRSHISPSQKMKKGMKSICIHPGTFIKSETTSSMIVDYINDIFIVWFTGCSHPCVSLFKPIVFSDGKTAQGFDDMDFSIEYCKNATDLSRVLVKNYSLFLNNIKPIRDKYQSDFKQTIYQNIYAKEPEQLIFESEKCIAMESEYVDQVKQMI